MKLNKLTKGLFAAAALTAAGFANAGAVASADLTINNFAIIDTDGNVFEDIILTSNDYFGSAAGTVGDEQTIESLFNNPSETEFDEDGLGYPNFDLAATGANGSASVMFDGIATQEGGASGVTSATASIVGTGTSAAGANLENSANFFVNNFDANDDDTFDVALSFSYIVDLVADSTVAWEQGAAEAFASFTVTLFGTQGTSLFSMTSDFTNEGLANVSESDDVLAFVTLKEGENYFLNVTQVSDVDVQSVSEPASLALFGLGLLGLAGAARRRKA